MAAPNDGIDFLRAERRATSMGDRGRKRDGAANTAGIQVASVGDPRRVPIADLEIRFNASPTPGLSAPIETTTHDVCRRQQLRLRRLAFRVHSVPGLFRLVLPLGHPSRKLAKLPPSQTRTTKAALTDGYDPERRALLEPT